MALRYGWHPACLPSNCSCGSTFSVERCISCNRGGFPILPHDELKHLTASLLTEVHHEPDLQAIDGKSFIDAATNTPDGARLDIAMNGFWGGNHERSFCGVRVFNLHAPSTYKMHRKLKKKAYEKKLYRWSMHHLHA